MRYCVRYRVIEKNWVVADAGNDNQILGVHATKAEAYAQALAAHQNCEQDSSSERRRCVREADPHSLVKDRFRKDISDLARTS